MLRRTYYIVLLWMASISAMETENLYPLQNLPVETREEVVGHAIQNLKNISYAENGGATYRDETWNILQLIFGTYKEEVKGVDSLVPLISNSGVRFLVDMLEQRCAKDTPYELPISRLLMRLQSYTFNPEKVFTKRPSLYSLLNEKTASITRGLTWTRDAECEIDHLNTITCLWKVPIKQGAGLSSAATKLRFTDFHIPIINKHSFAHSEKVDIELGNKSSTSYNTIGIIDKHSFGKNINTVTMDHVDVGFIHPYALQCSGTITFLDVTLSSTDQLQFLKHLPKDRAILLKNISFKQINHTLQELEKEYPTIKKEAWSTFNLQSTID